MPNLVFGLMNYFRITTHLSEILEESDKQVVIIFKYSNDCASSTRLKIKLEKEMTEKTLTASVFLVTVQTEPVLSKKISELFDIKHESPQIIILNKRRVTYSAHHNNIKIENFVFI